MGLVHLPKATLKKLTKQTLGLRRPLMVITKQTIILVGIYFINNSKGQTYLNGRLDFKGLPTWMI